MSKTRRYSTFDMLSASPSSRSPLQSHDKFDDDPHSYDLLPLSTDASPDFSYDELQAKILGPSHLSKLLKHPLLLSNFADFLAAHSPDGLKTLICYLDSLKALKALAYVNAIAAGIEGEAVPKLHSSDLKKCKDAAFEGLLEELTKYVTHTMIQVVSHNVTKRITGDLRRELVDAVDGLGECFCLTDPRREDNPIILMSEEFNRVTQYGVSYAIGRNCRFLQGPSTDKKTVRRLELAIEGQKETSELFLNYRRDGSPFFNLLMVAPLYDSQGQIRYCIGAQIDVTNLLKDGIGLSSAEEPEPRHEEEEGAEEKDEFRELAELFNDREIETGRNYGGRLHSGKRLGREGTLRRERNPSVNRRPRVLVADNTPPFEQPNFPRSPSLPCSPTMLSSGRDLPSLKGVYQNWLLIRPYPSLRILFTSPSLRTPGIHQLPFLSKVGGSPRVREEVHHALKSGDSVTAKVCWLTNRDSLEGRDRWIHCTPLQDGDGNVGVWMVLVVDPIDQRRRREASVYQPAPIPEMRAEERDEEELLECSPFLAPQRLPPTPTSPASNAIPPAPTTVPQIVRQDVEFDFDSQDLPSPFRLSDCIPKRSSPWGITSKGKR
ncbi:hypothetical protein FN846DRAFT_285094 [Sphaerosporella brunnea]|uniref:PAC domain-containing protein n=1 Tax=Sphaerosporella brunnea TaxID=1250544 RepID=A0A5J5EM57_9PEZI|nr:hypothetical protein FN846DRAFT_285094 [Sphaerosporella brunnea]